MKKLLLLFISFSSVLVQAQTIQKRISVQRTEKAPHIDGVPDDEIWTAMQGTGDFRQFLPNFDAGPSQPTDVKIAYDNSAIYVAAFMYDSQPDSILRQLTQRDQSGNADQFSVAFDTFNDNQNAFVFAVTAAGVQIDDRIGPNSGANSAANFDVVWESSVKVNARGWVAEMRIPFSALRFPKKDIQQWAVNFKREIRRYREEDFWAQTPTTAQNIVPYFGQLSGLEHISPPVRLFLTPYIGSTVSHYPLNKAGKSNYTPAYSAGADLKYGINESFTLDMTLVPDFGQVPSDPQVLNLTPFEVQFNENRDFFKEGTDLFNQGQLFYARRIGRTPGGFNRVQGMEGVSDNPSQVRLLNASKITGRTPGGLGLGILNAITARTEAHVLTPSGADSAIVTEPFTNYNVIALNQTLSNNSYVSLINTNVNRRDVIKNNANVTGLSFALGNKTNTYALQGFMALSQKIYTDNVSDGFKYTLQYGKINGNFQFNLLQNVESDTYNPNDLGLLKAPDEFTNSAKFNYQTFKPFKNILRTRNEITLNYSTTYKTRQFQDAGINYLTSALFRNFLYAQVRVQSKPNINDFYEARTPGRVFKRLAYLGFDHLLSSDYRKRAAVDLQLGYFDNFVIRRPFMFVEVSPRYRFSDRLLLIFKHRYEQDRQQAFADKVGKDVIFAERYVQTDVSELEGSYGFSPNMSFSVRGRYYWSRVKNYGYALLGENGDLQENSIGYNRNNDQNVNFFNADLVYRWRFAPGSDLFVVYKNNTQAYNNRVLPGYFNNIRSTFNNKQQNTLNVKILYFLDYQSLKKRFRA